MSKANTKNNMGDLDSKYPMMNYLKTYTSYSWYRLIGWYVFTLLSSHVLCVGVCVITQCSKHIKCFSDVRWMGGLGHTALVPKARRTKSRGPYLKLGSGGLLNA